VALHQKRKAWPARTDRKRKKTETKRTTGRKRQSFAATAACRGERKEKRGGRRKRSKGKERGKRDKTPPAAQKGRSRVSRFGKERRRRPDDLEKGERGKRDENKRTAVNMVVLERGGGGFPAIRTKRGEDGKGNTSLPKEKSKDHLLLRAK